MIVLGIESSAHTLGIGIFDGKKILANEKISYRPPSGMGIKPSDSAEFMAQNAHIVLRKALERAGLNLKDIDVFAFTKGPGIGHCLRVGATLARFLAKKYNKPLMGVNHCIAHLEVGRVVTGAKDPVMLYVSGGNTQVIAFDNGRYRVFGETLDLAYGNMQDMFGRLIGLDFPAGPKVEELAKKGERYIELPYSVKGMDVSFSGMYTKLVELYKSGKYRIEDLLYSMQETAFAMLIEISERAMAHVGKEELILAGGVAANQRFKEMAKIMCEERGAKFYDVPKEYALDNGAMIAVLGYLMAPYSKSDWGPIDQKWRTDEVEVTWR